VDAADYTVWRDAVGQTGPGLAADGDGNQVIDAADYTVWQAKFGATAATSVAAGAVPEPPSTILIFVLSSALLLTRHLTTR
jgi:hypothetical protein